jgi:hypothetical protein
VTEATFLTERQSLGAVAPMTRKDRKGFSPFWPIPTLIPCTEFLILVGTGIPFVSSGTSVLGTSLGQFFVSTEPSGARPIIDCCVRGHGISAHNIAILIIMILTFSYFHSVQMPSRILRDHADMGTGRVCSRSRPSYNYPRLLPDCIWSLRRKQSYGQIVRRSAGIGEGRL